MWHQQQAAGLGKAAPFHLAGWEIQAPGRWKGGGSQDIAVCWNGPGKLRHSLVTLSHSWSHLLAPCHRSWPLTLSNCCWDFHLLDLLGKTKKPSRRAISSSLKDPAVAEPPVRQALAGDFPACCCTLWCPAATRFSLEASGRCTETGENMGHEPSAVPHSARFPATNPPPLVTGRTPACSLPSPHPCLGLMDNSSPCLEWN